MTHRAAFGGFLLMLGALFTAGIAAQDLQALNGVIVRPTIEVGFAEQLELAARRALVPGAKVAAPLHAYSRDLACEDARLGALLGHRGSAAIVVQLGDYTIALYRPTVDDAVTYARQAWCNRTDADWYLATTYPLNGVEEAGHYLSRDVERIEEQLRDFRASR